MLSKNSIIPLYYQLANYLREKIVEGEYALGAQLPSERDLMQQFNISRNTVREAIDLLEQEGLVQRNHGRGTFVSQPRLKLGLTRLTSFSEDMKERGLKPSSKMLNFKIIYPPKNIVHNLQLSGGEKVLFVKRLRFADNIPMAINISYFSPSLCPKLSTESIGNNSIYDILEEKYHIQISHADQVIRAKVANSYEANLLQISINDPLLIIEGIVYDNENHPIESMSQIYRADRYAFLINPIRIHSSSMTNS